jgi:hypothetical protein
MMPVWRDQKALWDSDFEELLVITTSNLFNPNTASWRAMTALPGVTPDAAKALVALRDAGQPIGISEFAAVGGEVGGIYSPVSPVPSDTLVLTLWAPGVAWGTRSVVMLTPNSQYGPWLTLYVDRIEKRHVALDPQKIEKLPERAAGPLEQPSAPSLFGAFGG